MTDRELLELTAKAAGLFVPAAGIPEDGALMRFAHLVAKQARSEPQEEPTALREAAKQALEALEWCEPAGTVGRGGIEARKQAITALRSALAEPPTSVERPVNEPSSVPFV